MLPNEWPEFPAEVGLVPVEQPAKELLDLEASDEDVDQVGAA